MNTENMAICNARELHREALISVQVFVFSVQSSYDTEQQNLHTRDT